MSTVASLIQGTIAAFSEFDAATLERLCIEAEQMGANKLSASKKELSDLRFGQASLSALLRSSSHCLKMLRAMRHGEETTWVR